MIRQLCSALAAALLLNAFATAAAAPALIVVTGAPGETEYEKPFADWAAEWKKAGDAGGATTTLLGGSEDVKALEHLRETLSSQAKESPEVLWLVLLGHGTFDGTTANFNVAGDDLSAGELAKLLAPFQRPVVVVCGFSSSGAFLKPLSAANRVIITATRSGAEENYAHFSGFFSAAINDPAADLDQDGQTSLLEAWLSGGQRLTEFYEDEDRIPTEHPLLDDNGDGFGTPRNFFSGTRAIQKPTDASELDGKRAHQLHLIPSAAEREWPAELRARRDALELELETVKEQKSKLREDDYYARLERILLQIAKLRP
ncbi:MAG TPA: hypothetical protein VF614_17335 [Chthoniobacteraceae bacterium]|jgi:hypothetical protein